MTGSSIILMKHELAVTLIIFILLFIKLNRKESKAEVQPRDNETFINWVNILLFINLVAGFFLIKEGALFGDMFYTNPLMALEKNILNFGTFIISLQSHHWLKQHKHVPEFYMLMLSTLLGMFFMLSSRNLLMFYLGLELSNHPFGRIGKF
ncbi:MAG: hypothetical protein HC867_09305 [Bacteroidia bacterium]|nr:hypothetical protein [Bacteroidia bacterium]